MKTQICPGCLEELETSINRCPHCGFPESEYREDFYSEVSKEDLKREIDLIWEMEILRFKNRLF